MHSERSTRSLIPIQIFSLCFQYYPSKAYFVPFFFYNRWKKFKVCRWTFLHRTPERSIFVECCWLKLAKLSNWKREYAVYFLPLHIARFHAWRIRWITLFLLFVLPNRCSQLAIFSLFYGHLQLLSKAKWRRKREWPLIYTRMDQVQYTWKYI